MVIIQNKLVQEQKNRKVQRNIDFRKIIKKIYEMIKGKISVIINARRLGKLIFM